MGGRDGYPAGVPCWVDVRAADPRAAAEFYGGVFGWQFEDVSAPGATDRYFVARLDGLDVAAIGSPAAGADDAARGGGELGRDPGDAAAATGPAGGAGWATYVCVEDAAAAAARAEAAGGRVLSPPWDVREAGRAAVLADPAGAELRLWEPRGHAGAQLVNAPRTWNWSDLATGDPDGAIAFYGAVFGWEATAVDFGGAGDDSAAGDDGTGGEGDAAGDEASGGDADAGSGAGPLMWRLPGYGDVLAERDPSLRERHAQPGVPEGFSDAVGWLVPPVAPGAAARWTVTFAVADVDATAAAALGLGGSVATAPHDVGGVSRVAVLRDPEGAAFTVSAYSGLSDG